MVGQLVAGETGKSFELVVKNKRKLPEIWVTNLFDEYGDVVVK
jgi:hypothetical protein